MHKTILFSSAFTLGAFVSPLNAQTPTNTEPTEVSVLSDEEALTLDARYYARTYGTSLEEAMRRVALMASAQEDLADGIVQAGGRYAWAFFNHDGEFELVILTTGTEQMPSGTITRRGKGAVASQSAPGQLARELGVTARELAQAARVVSETQTAKINYRPGRKVARQAVMNAIDRMYPALAEFYPALQGIGYDEKRGVIVVQVVGPDVAPIPIEISRSLPVETEIEALKGPIRPAAARGGTRLEQRGTDNLVCTAGFIGRNPSGTRGIVTAKHCDDSRAGPLEYQDGSTAYNVTFDAGLSRPVAEADIAFLTIPSSLSTLPQFFGNRNEAARNLTGRRTLSSTQARVTDGVAQGSVVCYYGMRTGPIVGQSCGEVTYKGYYEGQPGKAGYKVQIEGADLACNQGDSGGPVFAWNTAFGIVGGCDPYSSVKGGTDRMVYTSTDALYAYGYSLAY